MFASSRPLLLTRRAVNLGGNTSPSAGDIKEVLESVGLVVAPYICWGIY
jgi:hypothetical protein